MDDKPIDFFLDSDSPAARFDAWLGRKGVKESTFNVYRGMFRRLAEWVSSADALTTLNSQSLEGWFEGKSLHPMTRHRYLLLLSAYLKFINALDGRQDQNAARSLLLSSKAPEPDPPTFLDDDELMRIRAVLAEMGSSIKWKKRKDAAAASVLLACGLHAHELVALTEDDYREGGYPVLRIRARAAHQARTVPFLDLALLEIFRSWLQCRQEIARTRPMGSLLFPANETGKAIVHSTLYRMIAKVSVQAFGRAVSPAILRNTFAKVASSRGFPDTQIQLWLGHAHLEATLRITEACAGCLNENETALPRDTR